MVKIHFQFLIFANGMSRVLTPPARLRHMRLFNIPPVLFLALLENLLTVLLFDGPTKINAEPSKSFKDRSLPLMCELPDTKTDTVCHG